MEVYTENNTPGELASLYTPEVMTFNTKLMQRMIDDLNASVIGPAVSTNQLFAQYWPDHMHHDKLLNGAILLRHFQDALKKWGREAGLCLVLISNDSMCRGQIDVEGNDKKYILKALGLLIVKFEKAIRKNKAVKKLPEGEVANFEYSVLLAPQYDYKKTDGPFIELYNENLGNVCIRAHKEFNCRNVRGKSRHQ